MTTPLPGWYQDPDQPNQQKWWDGTAWTDYTLPLADGASAESADRKTETQSAEEPGRDGAANVPDSGQGHAPLIPPAHSGSTAARPLPGQEFPGQEDPRREYPGQEYTGAQPGHPAYQQGYPGAQPAGQAYPQGYQGSPTAYPAYPGYQAYAGYQQAPPRSNPLALTGFILGLVAMFFFWIPFIGTLLALAAGAFSAIGLSNQGPDRAPVYKVFGIIGLIFGIIFTVLTILFLALIFSDFGGPSY